MQCTSKLVIIIIIWMPALINYKVHMHKLYLLLYPLHVYVPHEMIELRLLQRTRTGRSTRSELEDRVRRTSSGAARSSRRSPESPRRTRIMIMMVKPPRPARQD